MNDDDDDATTKKQRIITTTQNAERSNPLPRKIKINKHNWFLGGCYRMQ